MKKKNRALRALLLMTVMAAGLFPTPASAQSADNDIISDVYTIDRERKLVGKAQAGVTAEEIANGFYNGTVEIPGGVVGTGAELRYSSGAGGGALSLVVSGDVDGDGRITAADAELLKKHLLGAKVSDAVHEASDINSNGKITVTDYILLKKAAVGAGAISASSKLSAGDAPAQAVCMTVGAAAEGGYVRSSDVSVVSVNGGIAKAMKMGSAALYDQTGAVTVINVISGSMSSAGSRGRVMAVGETWQAAEGHVGGAASSTDESVAKMNENGVIMASKAGKAEITVRLGGSNKAQVSIVVFEGPVLNVKLTPDSSQTLTSDKDLSGAEWTVEDENVCTLDGMTVKAGNLGQTSVYASKDGKIINAWNVKVAERKRVALTLDDGPSGLTEDTLDYLDSVGVKVTYFVCGYMMDTFRTATAEIVKRGHEIGWHSYSHEYFDKLTTAQIKDEYARSVSLLQDIAGVNYTVWRSPGGRMDQEVLDAVPLPHIMWSVDPRDWASKDAGSVYDEVMENTTDGSIVLLHDIYKSSNDALRRIIESLSEQGYEFMTVSELLQSFGTAPAAGHSYSKG